MTLNMNSLAVLTKRCLLHVLERKGEIMNITSTGGFQTGPYLAIDCATKTYILSFTESLAAAPSGTEAIVTPFRPGPICSGFGEGAAMNNSALIKDEKLPTADEVGPAGYGCHPATSMR